MDTKTMELVDLFLQAMWQIVIKMLGDQYQQKSTKFTVSLLVIV